MNEKNHETPDSPDLLDLLGRSDPIDPATLPTSADPSARSMIDRIVADTTPTGTAVTGTAVTGTGTAAAGSASVVDLESAAGDPADTPLVTTAARRIERPVPQASGSGRGRMLWIGSVAAAILLVVGLTAVVGGGGTPALAEVQSAAQATTESDTGRVSTTFSLSGQDSGGEDGVGESMEAIGTLEAAYDGDDIAFTVDVDGQAGGEDLPVDELPIGEIRVVDGVLYAFDGSQWLSADTDGLFGTMISDFVDPRSILTRVQELNETTEVGTETVDGVEVTRYRSIVDLQDETLTESGWLATDGVPIDADGEITVDLLVDGEGLVHRIDVSGDLQEPAAEDGTAGTGTATFAVSTRFHDLGGDIEIEAPADAVDLGSMAGLDG